MPRIAAASGIASSGRRAGIGCQCKLSDRWQRAFQINKTRHAIMPTFAQGFQVFQWSPMITTQTGIEKAILIE